MGTIVDGFKSKWVYAGDQYVAVASGRISGAWSDVMANAHLIAAAPDLLAACEAAEDIIPRLFEGRATIGETATVRSDIVAAIAKAKGAN